VAQRQLASTSDAALARSADEITAEKWGRKKPYGLAQPLLDTGGVQSIPSLEADATLLARSKPRTCPYCESTYVARSRRQGLWGMPVLRLLGVHVYRCTECWRRFRAFQRKRESARAA
jgi:DNA-directed RNA polymerase subunit RPC12/RpoP